MDTVLNLPASIVSPGLVGTNFGSISALIFLPILFFLVKSWDRVVVGILAYWEGVSEPWRLFCTPWGWLIITWMHVKCAWCVPPAVIPWSAGLTLPRCAIDHNHKWFVYIIFGYFDISWAYKLIDVSVYANWEGYVLSYGQVRLPLRFWQSNADQASACLGVIHIYYDTHSLCDEQVRLFPSLGYTQFSPTSPKPMFGQGSEALYPQVSCPRPSPSLQCYFIPREAHHRPTTWPGS